MPYKNNIIFKKQKQLTMKTWIGILMISLIALTSCNSSKKATTSTKKVKPKGIKFIESKSYDNVLSLAQAQNKPIIVDFYTTWCAPCKWLEQDVFALPQVYEYYNENVVNFKVNAEDFDGVSLAQQYEVGAYPTLVFITQNGDFIRKHEGTTTATNFMEWGKEAVVENNKVR